MIVRLYEQHDEDQLVFDTSQDYMRDFLSEAALDLEPLVKQDLVWTGEHNGKVVAMGGVVPVWHNRAQAWMWMSEVSGRHMITIHREVKKFLDACPVPRIEAHVNVGFKPGVRWMQMLGFEMEGYMRKFGPSGADMLLFARVK